MKVRCCLCNAMIDYEEKRVIEIRYEDEPQEYAVCELCFEQLRNADLIEMFTKQQGG